MRKYAIVVGGGRGMRMNSLVPKQFMKLGNQPILMHSLRAFASSLAQPVLVLVLNKRLIHDWQLLCTQYHFDLPHILVEGGDTRFHSVQNGLNYIQENFQDASKSLIAIHDGVRPLVKKDLIDRGFLEANEKAAVVPAVQSKESVRIRNQDYSKAIDRSIVFLVQTPQFFKGDMLMHAYQQNYCDQFTDDASVVEKAGYPIHIMDGDTRNIKITFPEDIPFAELLLQNKKS